MRAYFSLPGYTSTLHDETLTKLCKFYVRFSAVHCTINIMLVHGRSYYVIFFFSIVGALFHITTSQFAHHNICIKFKYHSDYSDIPCRPNGCKLAGSRVRSVRGPAVCVCSAFTQLTAANTFFSFAVSVQAL